MATSGMLFQESELIGAPDGLTNSYIRRQIQRLRLSKGLTLQDLEQAAGMAANSLGDLEAGVHRISLNILQKIIEALKSDITEVWPSPERVAHVESHLPIGQASDPLAFSRLAEIHSLTSAKASCMFMSDNRPDLIRASSEVKPEPALQFLSSINLDKDEREWLRRKLIEWTVTAPWDIYLRCENGRSLYLCLKNAHLAFWAEGFLQCCLSTWLTSAPL